MRRLVTLVCVLTSMLCAGPAGAQAPAMTRESMTALSSFLSAAVSRGDVPGIVVLVTNPEQVLYHQAFGKRDVANNLPMEPDTIFRIASMTKALTSTAVMMLVEEGKLGLDDDVARYLPAFKTPQVLNHVDAAAGTYNTRPATKPITIRQLLTHTSGIGYSWSDPGLALAEKQTGKSAPEDLPLVHEPGEKWTYGASTHVLSEIVERVTAQPFDTFIRTRLFEPLGMRDTGWSVPANERARVTTAHRKADGVFKETPNSTQLVAEPRGDGRLFSTAADYGQFMRMILNRGESGSRRLLKAETVDAMSRPQTGDVRVRLQPSMLPDLAKPFPMGAGVDQWGLGFQLALPATRVPLHRNPGSMSWAGINNTFFWIDPRARIGVVVLMQVLPFYDEAALRVLDGVETRVYEGLRLTAGRRF